MFKLEHTSPPPLTILHSHTSSNQLSLHQVSSLKKIKYIYLALPVLEKNKIRKFVLAPAA